MCWKLVWSGRLYQMRISVPLFTLLRSHSPHSARRQMPSGNLANMLEMRFVIAFSIVVPLAYKFKKAEKCACVFVSVGLSFSAHTCLSEHIQQTNLHECTHVCVLFCKAAALYQTIGPAVSLQTPRLDGFILSSIANIIFYAERQSCKSYLSPVTAMSFKSHIMRE